MNLAMAGNNLMERENFPDPGNGDRYSGIRSLWMKVIIRAMFDWASYRDSTKLEDKKKAESARIWLFEPNELFNGFESICKTLDMDIKKIRIRAQGMSKDDVAKIEFKERRGFVELESSRRLHGKYGDDDEEF